MIQITLDNKLVKQILDAYIEDHLMEFEFSNKDLKAAGVPTRAQLTKQIMSDVKFQKALAKRLSVFVNDGDAIHDALFEMPMPALEAELKKLRSVRFEA